MSKKQFLTTRLSIVLTMHSVQIDASFWSLCYNVGILQREPLGTYLWNLIEEQEHNKLILDSA